MWGEAFLMGLGSGHPSPIPIFPQGIWISLRPKFFPSFQEVERDEILSGDLWKLEFGIFFFWDVPVGSVLYGLSAAEKNGFGIFVPEERRKKNVDFCARGREKRDESVGGCCRGVGFDGVEKALPGIVTSGDTWKIK